MKKNIVIIASLLLLLLQMAILFGGIWLTVSLQSDCSFVKDEFFMWQCSTDTDPVAIPSITFMILPRLLAQFIFTKLGRSISWKRIIITHVIVAVLLWTTLYYLDSPS